ncbi:MAG: RNA methyltransferase [Kiritimatiellales bacterium]
MKTILSKDNAKLKRLRMLLKSKKARQESSCFLIESVRALSVFSGAGILPQYQLKEVWISNQTDVTGIPAVPEVYRIPHEFMEQLSDCKTSQGVLGVVEFSGVPFTEFPVHGNFLLADHITDPGNLGTLIRTAAAFGFSGIFLYGDTVEIFNPKTVRATMGTLPLMPHWTVDAGIFDLIHSGGYELLSTVVSGGEELSTMTFGEKNVLAVGSEARGVSPEVLRHAARGISIPMSPAVESLNAAVAGGVCMFAMQQNLR